jgi:hypothetical protein
MAQVALAEKPFDVTVGCHANPLAAERWPLVVVAHGVGHMALQAMVAVDQGSGGNGIRLVGQSVCASVVFGWNMLPAGTGSCYGQGGPKEQEEESREFTHYWPPSFV